MLARLSFCKLVHFLAIVDAATLYLSVECDTMKSHIGADWPCERAVMLVSLGDDAFPIPETMTHAMGNGTIFREVSYYSAILTPAAPLSGDLGPLFCHEGLQS